VKAYIDIPPQDMEVIPYANSTFKKVNPQPKRQNCVVAVSLWNANTELHGLGKKGVHI
jgi:hypothetical protein